MKTPNRISKELILNLVYNECKSVGNERKINPGVLLKRQMFPTFRGKVRKMGDHYVDGCQFGASF